MTKLVADQADGLRRLLAHTPTRVVAIAGMRRREGVTSAAMNLAAALVHQGKEVLLVDEHPAHADSVAGVWSIRAPAGEGPVRAECGVEFLAAPRWQPQASIDLRARRHGGVVLIDAALDDEGRLSPFAQAADELLLVLQPRADSITTAYAGIKRLHYAHGLKQLRFLVNGASGVDEAQKIMSNLANTGSRYLAVSLEPSGWVRADAHLADARCLGRTVVESFPATPAAVDFRGIAADMLRWPWRAPARTAQADDARAQERRMAMSQALRVPAPRPASAAA
ncbi:MAG: flagellar biosynthesis protein FlhG [Variovorax sp.]|nr:flagellar biosynthesis protein FlhG [Variovorax sp.]